MRRIPKEVVKFALILTLLMIFFNVVTEIYTNGIVISKLLIIILVNIIVIPSLSILLYPLFKKRK